MLTLYFVTTALPGPGAGALVRDKARELQERGYVLGMVDELAEAADGACEFVELEDGDGDSRGANATGAAWLPHPTDPKLHRLGPFAPAGVPLEAVSADELRHLHDLLALEGFDDDDRREALEILERIEQRKGAVDAR